MLVNFVKGQTVDATAARLAVSMILDTLGVMVAGSAEPGVKVLAAALEPAPGGVPSLWAGHAYRAEDSALLMGMASHVLDYDDVSMLAVCHPSAPVLSALLNAAPWREVAGADFIDAFVIGTEVLIRLGQAMGFGHYALGFHATATLGSVGAAAACARLLKLNAVEVRNALAIAASLSSGLRKNFGSMVKSLHVGIAAANGLKAARLAAAGIEGAPEVLEGRGFFFAFSGGETDTWPQGLALGEPFAIVDPGFEQKRYPCCYLLHKMIEGTLALKRHGSLGLDDVASVRVDVPQGGTSALIHPYPKTGLNALFSGPYAVAACLEDGRIDLKSFTDEAVLRPEIQVRLRDVALVEASAVARSGSDVGGGAVTVTLQPRRGPAISQSVTASPGSPEDPLTVNQARSKWLDCVQHARPGIDPVLAMALFEDGPRLADAQAIDDWFGRVSAALRGGGKEMMPS